MRKVACILFVLLGLLPASAGLADDVVEADLVEPVSGSFLLQSASVDEFDISGFLESLPDLGVPPLPPPPCFTGSVELGLNGAAGNSEVLKLRFATNNKYETPRHLLTTEFLYAYATSDAIESENRAYIKGRYEWKVAATPWSLFVDGEALYDAFTAYDMRLASHVGVAYVFVRNDALFLKGLLGGGASRELGGPENRFMPEALIGGEFEYRFTERQKITTAATIYPDLQEIGEFRAEARAAYEILVDPAWNLTLKIGAFDRYDSTPEGKKPNDVEYFAMLLWKY